MIIAVIGTGNVGSALASQWSKAGHAIRLGVRNTHSFKGMHLLEQPGIEAEPIARAVAQADVVLFATPPEVLPTLIEGTGDLAGKVVIDATNSIRSRPEPFPTAYHALIALTDAEVVKCFNTTGYENMLDPLYNSQRLDMFMAGDSERAKAVAAQLAVDCGFDRCIDFGGADQVVLLEQFALAWINLAIFQEMGRNVGLKILTRPGTYR